MSYIFSELSKEESIENPQIRKTNTWLAINVVDKSQDFFVELKTVFYI